MSNVENLRPHPRSYADFVVTHITGKKLTGGLVLHVNHAVQVLFNENQQPIAIYDGDVYFPDVAFTRREQSLLNDFKPYVPHARVDAEAFDYQLAAALLRNLRPLLRRQPPTESGTQAGDEHEPPG